MGQPFGLRPTLVAGSGHLIEPDAKRSACYALANRKDLPDRIIRAFASTRISPNCSCKFTSVGGGERSPTGAHRWASGGFITSALGGPRRYRRMTPLRLGMCRQDRPDSGA